MTENNANQNKRPFEIGAFSFVELAPDPVTGKMISPTERMQNLLETIELADQVGLDVFGLGDVLDCLRLGWTQSNRYFGRGSTGEHGFDDFFKLVREIRKVMAVPKPSEFVD